MELANPRSTARIGGHPIHPMLVPFPVVCFIGALVTDIAYWRTADMTWEAFSSWLIFFGLIMGAMAAVAGLIDFIGSRRVRSLGAAWLHFVGNAAALVIALFNMLVHNRDGWTAVVPTGLVLSALTVLVLLVTGWLGGALVYRHRVGVVG